MLREFSAGSYVGAAVALIASRISQSSRVHVTFGVSALKFDTAPQHHVRLVHFLAHPSHRSHLQQRDLLFVVFGLFGFSCGFLVRFFVFCFPLLPCMPQLFTSA